MATPRAYGPTLTIGDANGVKIAVGWNDLAGPGGVFTIGESAIQDGSVLAGLFNPPDWEVVTGGQQVTLTRGRQDATSPVSASTANVNIVDEDDDWNPSNSDSALYAKLDVSRPMRVQVHFAGMTYDLWQGVTEEVDARPSSMNPYATLVGIDLLERLAVEKPVIKLVASTTTGAAIGLILDAVGWPTADRQLDTGDAIINFSADGQTDALSLIGTLLSLEGGSFFMSAGGDAVYRDHIGQTTRQATITSINLAVPGLSVRNVGNRAIVTAGSGQAQTYIDGGSASRYGTRDVQGSPLQSDMLPSDSAALALAERLVTLAVNRKSPIFQLTLVADPANDPDTYVQMLQRDLGDRIALADPQGHTGGEYTIEGITHTIRVGGDHTVSWVLMERATNLFTLGQSVIGGTDVLAA